MRTNSPAAPNLESPPWHLLETWQAAAWLNVDPDTGLSQDAATKRLEQHGPNALAETRRRGPARILFGQFADFMIVVLILAGVVSGLLGDVTDTIVILVIVILNALIGFVQEYRAERAVAALKRMSAPTARVLRGGQLEEIPARDLVPGDVVVLEAGNVVPADVVLIESAQLQIEESALTGESQPVAKVVGPLRDRDAPVGDRLNMAFKGTVVTYGRGRGIVVASGRHTQFGQIAELLGEEKESRTPLQKRLASFGQRLALLVLAICAIIFLAGWLRGEPVVLMLLTAISLAVAAIPEALPAVATVSLALGARKMIRRHALIRRLPAVETLGSVTYICSDKTGTLTENRMRAEASYAGGKRCDGVPSTLPVPLLRGLALNNDATADKAGNLVGDPTEIALYEAASAAGYAGAEQVREQPRVAEIPFDSERKRMTTLHAENGRYVSYTKGAPESVLPGCERQWGEPETVPLESPSELLAIADQMAADGLRVLALACRDWPEQPAALTAEVAESGLCFLGLVGLMDPPRPEARQAVALCRSAGITPVMITGDHPATARAIALRLGIDDDDGVVTGQALARMSDAELARSVERIRVYARVAPEQKIRIVRALQENGEFVAMTGDGVNDAPALKRANIGIAMGKSGTDVAREAAHMVLLDDNFASIVGAVREGRRIFDNIRKFIKYTMTSNSAEIWTLFLAPFLLLPIPLQPVHILWINLVTDGLPGLALSVEPEESGLMRRPPRAPQESIFAGGMWQHILWVGLLMGGVSLSTQAWAYFTGSAHWQSMVFTVLTLSQMGHVLAIRSDRESLWQRGLFSNRALLGSVLLTFGLQLAVLYVPVLQPIFRTQALEFNELMLCLALSTIVLFAVEIEKWLRRRGWLNWA